MNSFWRIARAMAFFLLASFVWCCMACLAPCLLVKEESSFYADAIVLLAGPDAYVERAERAASAYAAGQAPTILLTDDGGKSGWSQSEQRVIPYVELTRRTLIARGVADNAIHILAPIVTSTMMEAELLGSMSKASGWKSLLIVTSDYHSRRALWTFKEVFHFMKSETKVGIGSANIKRQTTNRCFWWFSKNGWRDVAGEYAKAIYYYIAQYPNWR